jgi:hypothetical protein
LLYLYLDITRIIVKEVEKGAPVASMGVGWMKKYIPDYFYVDTVRID